MKKNILLLVFSVFISLAAAEFILRYAGYEPWHTVLAQDDVTYSPFMPLYQDTIIGYRMHPGVFEITYNHEYKFKVSHNAAGYRLTAPADKTRHFSIIPELNIFGDSFTHGSGMNDDETYPWKLSEMLPSMNVNNFAISGYGVANVFDQIKSMKPDSGDVFVYSYFAQHNNRFERYVLRRMYVNEELKAIMGYLSLKEQGGKLTTQFQAYKYHMWALTPFSAIVNLAEEKYNYYYDKLDNEKSWNIACAALKEMKAYCSKNGATFILAGIRNDSDTGKMLDYCKSQNILNVDISVNLDDDHFNQMPYDDHPNAYSNTLFANRLHDFLASKQLINKKLALAAPVSVN